jgi:hypothetical protein
LTSIILNLLLDRNRSFIVPPYKAFQPPDSI